jgi:hypothetical protein
MQVVRFWLLWREVASRRSRRLRGTGVEEALGSPGATLPAMAAGGFREGKEGKGMSSGRRRRNLVTAVALLVLLSVVCVGLGWSQGRRGDAFTRVQDVRERHTDQLLAIRGVVGTALGETLEGAPTVRVFTERPDVPDVPEDLEGVPVTVEVTGEFFALGQPAGKPAKPDARLKPTDRWPRPVPKPDARLKPTDRWPPPVPIGVSTGNEFEVSAGTISCRVMAGSKVYALSNNHVYALENTAPFGSRVLQPGLYDTQGVFSVSNVIGTLDDYEPIDFSGGDNTIDAAIALSDKTLISNSTPPDGYGTPGSSAVPASVGLRVQKYGRTTSLTKGSVYAIDATVLVGYSSGTARFVHQVFVTGRGFIKAGDSGSLLVTDPSRAPVGLLFAGNASGSLAVANPIGPVLDRFGVTIK